MKKSKTYPSQCDITYTTPQQPRQVRLDTIAACNAECLSCHRFGSGRKGQMPAEFASEIIQDIATWSEPLYEIVPVNYGEFFLRQDWLWILQLITKRLPKTQIVLPTNGSLLTEEDVDILCTIPTIRIINFSINAYFAETYEAFTNLDASNLERIEQNIKRIKVQRKDIIVWASMVFDPMYQSDLERDMFINHWKSKVDNVWILPAASAGRPNKKPVQPLLAPCRSIFSDIVVGFDGKLSSCCFDAAFSLDLGIYEGNLLEAWHNPKIEQFRELHNEHLRKEVALCKVCTFA